MAIVRKKGPFDDYYYDDSQFEFNEWGELHYIGTETDGSKIKIPDGIRSCIGMFENTNIKFSPVIPDSVFLCQNMFANCKSLEVLTNLPKNLSDCRNMCRGCSSLKKIPEVMPKSVMYVSSCFRGCKLLENGIQLPDSLDNCEELYCRCINLKSVPNIPKNARYAQYMFQGCDSLKSVPDLENIRFANGMFFGCLSLELPPKFNEVILAEDMFYKCVSLKFAPVIPLCTKETEGIFEDCSSEIQLEGQWNLEHRGRLYNL